MTHLQPYPDHILIPPRFDNKDQKSRLLKFVDWLAERGDPWYQPDLAAYRDYLLYRLSPSSTIAHLATIRGRYQTLLSNNRFRDWLYSMTPDDETPANRKAMVDELVIRLQNAIDPANAPVKIIQSQDRPDNATGLRLTANQANALLVAPGVKTLMGLRDTTMLALMLCTGIREGELVALDVRDLRQQLGGELALHIREGKGAKERLIPYGSLDFCLVIVDRWLVMAGIESGPVFRGFYKGAKRVRPSRIHIRAINQIFDRYPVSINGMMQTVNPHDLRRTYARRLYEAGMDLLAIQQNMGHSDHKTTLNYIGQMDASHRQPPTVYQFDLSTLP